jgi:ferredoxin
MTRLNKEAATDPVLTNVPGATVTVFRSSRMTRTCATARLYRCACLRAPRDRDPGRVFVAGQYLDKTYKTRRDRAFIIAVNCGQAGGTCFCVSMDAGPKVEAGYDLALTELVDDSRHMFVVEIGSAAGRDLIAELAHHSASEDEIAAAERVVAQTTAQMGRTLDTDGLKELLQANPNHPRWDEVAGRCLTCGNCTNVCPTCFCTTIDDTTDLSGRTAERVRRWDSCFTLEFSYVHGGNVRSSARSRYRQGMTHKLAHWIDQFGTSGLGPEFGAAISRCARNLRFTAGDYLFREGEPANELYLIRQGTVALELHSPGQTPIVVANLARRRRPRRVVARAAALLLDIRCAGFRDRTIARGRHPMPAGQVRGGSRSRLRADEAFRQCDGGTPARNAPAGGGCLRAAIVLRAGKTAGHSRPPAFCVAGAYRSNPPRNGGFREI